MTAQFITDTPFYESDGKEKHLFFGDNGKSAQNSLKNWTNYNNIEYKLLCQIFAQ